MAKQKFIDAAGREAYYDSATDRVYTEGGKTDTFYTKAEWNKRQASKYGSSTGKDPATSFAENITKSAAAAIKDQTGFLDKYTKSNPFSFDEELAKKSATAEYEPYYSELLQDYLDTVDLSRTTINDEKKLQSELHAYDIGKISREYTQAVSKAEEGFADQGMFYSGIKKRGLGQLDVANKDTTEIASLNYNAGQKAFDTKSQVLDLGANQKTRDLARQQETAVETGIQQRYGEQSNAYNNALTTAYARKYPTSSNPLAGYTVSNNYMMYS